MSSINFLNGNWFDFVSQIQETSNEPIMIRKKYVFFYLCANGSMQCRKMETETLSDRLLSDFFNANFINIRVYMGNLSDSDTLQRLKSVLNVEVETYPLTLFLNHQGKVVHQVTGDFSPNGLISEAKIALSLKFNWI